MARDDSSGGWLPVGGGGLSQVSVCRVRGARPEGGARQGHYVIHGERLRDQKVSHPGAWGVGWGCGEVGGWGWECRGEVRSSPSRNQTRVWDGAGSDSVLWMRVGSLGTIEGVKQVLSPATAHWTATAACSLVSLSSCSLPQPQPVPLGLG